MNDELLASTLRRCRGQYARPAGVTEADERACADRGLLKFYEWPSGHYQLTAAGKRFLADISECGERP